MSPIIQMTHFTSDDIEQKANKKPVMHLSKSDIKQSRKQMIILLNKKKGVLFRDAKKNQKAWRVAIPSTPPEPPFGGAGQGVNKKQ